ncbi:MAG TPA: hypothetical protein VFQ45_06920 [Longimicrobium sp.]|nr:hypothetical protein [Longimicrobium sp.]
MKKLSLDLDALQVETFDPDAPAHSRRGTVEGYCCNCCCCCCCCTCCQTCGDTCTNCPSCNYSCEPWTVCNDTCQYYSCFYTDCWEQCNGGESGQQIICEPQRYD